MLDLKPYQNHINNLCKLLRVRELELFGSATCDDFSPDSDIDVLVMFEGREQLFARYFDLKEGLEQIFDRRVDVVMPEAITNPVFREHVEKERTVVYGPGSENIHLRHHRCLQENHRVHSGISIRAIHLECLGQICCSHAVHYHW